jgi:hypothetical protein
MTVRKHLKQLVRSRMQKTGESYASARRQVIRQVPTRAGDPATRWHLPGNVPATTALRILVSHAGIRDPHTGQPFTEAMFFGIAGGIGVGVFSFYYEKGDSASFYVAGRHRWDDTSDYLQAACKRLGLTPVVRESSGAKTAEKQLRECLGEGPCVAWVDMAHLPHRGLPEWCSGGAYHVITVYRLDDDTSSALIGDLADDPISIALPDLARARERIKSQKNRLLSVAEAPSPKELAPLVREGLESCYRGLAGEGAKGAKGNFSLEALKIWATRLYKSKDKESWARVFPRGPRLWTGLTSIYDYIEHHGTGGGLCRPIFSDFLDEAADALRNSALKSLAEQYAELGRDWSALADEALPDAVPAMREAKDLYSQRSELTLAGGADAPAEIGKVWDRLHALGAQARTDFPLSESECDALLAKLQGKVMALYEGEQAARAKLAEVMSSI